MDDQKIITRSSVRNQIENDNLTRACTPRQKTGLFGRKMRAYSSSECGVTAPCTVKDKNGKWIAVQEVEFGQLDTNQPGRCMTKSQKETANDNPAINSKYMCHVLIVYTKSGNKLDKVLPEPIPIQEINDENKTIRFVEPRLKARFEWLKPSCKIMTDEGKKVKILSKSFLKAFVGEFENVAHKDAFPDEDMPPTLKKFLDDNSNSQVFYMIFVGEEEEWKTPSIPTRDWKAPNLGAYFKSSQYENKITASELQRILEQLLPPVMEGDNDQQKKQLIFSAIYG